MVERQNVTNTENVDQNTTNNTTKCMGNTSKRGYFNTPISERRTHMAFVPYRCFVYIVRTRQAQGLLAFLATNCWLGLLAFIAERGDRLTIYGCVCTFTRTHSCHLRRKFLLNSILIFAPSVPSPVTKHSQHHEHQHHHSSCHASCNRRHATA